MKFKIIVDSCCDVTPELREQFSIETVPLTLTLGDRHIQDDETLDLPQFMNDMKNCREKVGSAAPSPGLYRDAFLKAKKAFAVTLSSNLSGSFASAMAGRIMASEDDSETEIHVFDSKSASSGEVLLAVKIGEMLEAGAHYARIIDVVEEFVRHMKTYFVLENIDNLLKNGRIGKITGKLISALNIKPIMGSDGEGNIALYSHARGERQIIEKMTETVGKSERDVEGGRMVIAHCNNPGLAEKLKEAVLMRYRFRDILIVPTRGISSMYANEKGLIMSF